MRLAIIPARGGSKRIPRKNIRDFCGKPIIAWSIEAALSSDIFDKVIVSTDDEEIAKVAVHWGAEVPFMRPDSISGDNVGTAPVVRHAIEWFALKDKLFEHVCCIYAAAPFIRKEGLLRGLSLLEENGGFSVPVTSYPHPVQRALRVTEDGWLEMIQPEFVETRSQDLEETFHDVGQFYWGTYESWMSGAPILSKASPVIIHRKYAQDIDTEEDWECAEKLFLAMNERE